MHVVGSMQEQAHMQEELFSASSCCARVTARYIDQLLWDMNDMAGGLQKIMYPGDNLFSGLSYVVYFPIEVSKKPL